MSILPPPEALLIEQARTAIRPTLSVRQAAARADLSEGRWRQIVKGYQTARPDLEIPVRAPASTLARMAYVVEVSAGQLEDAGREDAAFELNLLHQGADEIDTCDLSSVPDQQLVDELSRRLSSRADTLSESPAKRTLPLHLVARRVSSQDSSTYQRD